MTRKIRRRIKAEGGVALLFGVLDILLRASTISTDLIWKNIFLWLLVGIIIVAVADAFRGGLWD